MKTGAEKRAYAKECAREWVEKMREHNAEFQDENPDFVSTIAEDDYIKAEREIEAALLRAAGLKQIRRP